MALGHRGTGATPGHDPTGTAALRAVCHPSPTRSRTKMGKQSMIMGSTRRRPPRSRIRISRLLSPARAGRRGRTVKRARLSAARRGAGSGSGVCCRRRRRGGGAGQRRRCWTLRRPARSRIRIRCLLSPTPAGTRGRTVMTGSTRAVRRGAGPGSAVRRPRRGRRSSGRRRRSRFRGRPGARICRSTGRAGSGHGRGVESRYPAPTPCSPPATSTRPGPAPHRAATRRPRAPTIAVSTMA